MVLAQTLPQYSKSPFQVLSGSFKVAQGSNDGAEVVDDSGHLGMVGAVGRLGDLQGTIR